MLKISNSAKKSNTDLIIAGFLIIFILTAINAIFYSIGYAFSIKVGTYIYTGDYLADLYKVTLSYPKARGLIESGGLTFPDILSPLLNVYYKYTYLGKEGLSIDQLTHFHLPPLTTALVFLLLNGFSIFGFIGTTLALLAATFGLIIFSSKLAIENKIDAYLFSMLIFISYPFIFLIQRGNFFAFFSFVFILFAILGLKKGKVLLPILLIALAINIRPNLVIYVTLLYFWPTRSFSRPVIAIVISLLIFITTLALDTHIYPDYTLYNFQRGLEIYNTLFVTGDWGFGYSSSLFTLSKFLTKILGIKLITIYAINFQIVFTTLTGIYIFWLYFKKSVCSTSFVFLITALSMLGTPIFADYHLLLFTIPAILVLMDQANKDGQNEQKTKINSIIFFTCCLMLSPLNYINYDGLYVFNLIKTLTAIFVGVYIIRKKAVL